MLPVRTARAWRERGRGNLCDNELKVDDANSLHFRHIIPDFLVPLLAEIILRSLGEWNSSSNFPPAPCLFKIICLSDFYKSSSLWDHILISAQGWSDEERLKIILAKTSHMVGFNV